MLSVWKRMAAASPSVVPRGARYIAYVSKAASPGRGLKKDPEEYMVSPSGVHYPGNQATLEPLKALLGQEFSLPDNLLLQTLVHKSFAHGKVPYNDKLAILGQQLIRLQAFRAAASEAVSQNDPFAINGQNFNISSNAVDVLASTPVLSAVCDKAGLEASIFYKNANANSSPLVKAKAINAIVGALTLERGSDVAVKFINTKLLNGELSVFSIADNLIVHK